MTASPRPLRPVPDRLPPRRRRPHRAVQLALSRGTPAAPSCSASRTPTASAAPRRTPGSSSTGSSWLGLTWDEGPFFQGEYGRPAPGRRRAPAGRGQGLPLLLHPRGAGRPARPGRSGGRRLPLRPALLPAVRRRGRARGSRAGAAVHHPLPLPDERDRLGRRGARADQLPGPGPRRLRHPAQRRHADLQYGRGDRRHRHADHPRDPRRRPHLQHAEADRAVPRARAEPMPVFAHVPMILGTDGKKLSQAARRHRRGRLPGPGHLPRGHAQLPRAAGLVARRRPRDHARGGDDRALHARGDPEEGGGVRHRRSWSG